MRETEIKFIFYLFFSLFFFYKTLLWVAIWKNELPFLEFGF